MFGKAIWDKLPECIFENFENARVEEGNFKIVKKHEGDLSQESPKPNMCLLVNDTKRTNTLCIF